MGWPMGLLVPTPIILISQRFYQLLKENGVKGLKAEVAHLVQLVGHPAARNVPSSIPPAWGELQGGRTESC